MLKVLFYSIFPMALGILFASAIYAAESDGSGAVFKVIEREGGFRREGSWILGSAEGEKDIPVGTHVTVVSPENPVWRFVYNYNGDGLMHGIQRVYGVDDDGEFRLLGKFGMKNGTGVILEFSKKSEAYPLPYRITVMENGRRQGPTIDLAFDEEHVSIPFVTWRTGEGRSGDIDFDKTIDLNEFLLEEKDHLEDIENESVDMPKSKSKESMDMPIPSPLSDLPKSDDP